VCGFGSDLTRPWQEAFCGCGNQSTKFRNQSLLPPSSGLVQKINCCYQHTISRPSSFLLSFYSTEYSSSPKGVLQCIRTSKDENVVLVKYLSKVRYHLPDSGPNLKNSSSHKRRTDEGHTINFDFASAMIRVMFQKTARLIRFAWKTVISDFCTTREHESEMEKEWKYEMIGSWQNSSLSQRKQKTSRQKRWFFFHRSTMFVEALRSTSRLIDEIAHKVC